MVALICNINKQQLNFCKFSLKDIKFSNMGAIKCPSNRKFGEAILSEIDGEMFPSESKFNSIKRDAFHEEDSAYTTLRKKIENSKLDDPLNESPSQIATTNWALPAKIQGVDELPNFKVLEANPIPPKIPKCYIFESIDLKVPRGVYLISLIRIFPSLPSTRPFGSSLASGSIGTPKLSECA
ncbi:hypothetical protein DVH24_001434 [Malus domestica]|uniref:Uncharacterized protein n=1 Tax=Malus domestica TaxID=3750 RepID=A0A498JZ70_MALDO|nr:hypothetical protein DVH24_001434 [Malus domestica]